MVAEQVALLQPFRPEVNPNWRKLRRLERKLDRPRRANNPEHYDERGRVKKGKHRWKVSKRQRKVQARRREVYRRLSATRKRSHGQLAHRVVALLATFQLEHLSYRGGLRRYGRSVGLCAPGLFVFTLCRLAASAGGRVVELNATRPKLSPTCQCGEQEKRAAFAALASVPRRESVHSATSILHIWRALSIQTPPCSKRVRLEMPGRVGNPSCRRLMSRPSETNLAAWTAAAVLLWRPRASESEWVECLRSTSQGGGPGGCSEAATSSESEASAAVMRPEPPV